jgi:Phytanoyl-CoA dioxygenase (PhyH)
MDIGDWQASKELNQIFADVRALDLVSNVAELEAYGFTIVEPRKIKSEKLFDRMLASCMRLADKADAEGRRMAKLVGTTGSDSSRIHYQLLTQDPVFAEAVMHPVALTLGRYLMGASARLFTASAFVKRGKCQPTLLHTDSMGTPPPLYPFGLVCNISWILTDYTKERGTFAMVPGSHRYCRHPTAIEMPKMMGGPNEDICVPIEAPPGSLIAFNGNTWHGTFPKTDEDFRAHVVTGYCRNFIMPAESNDDVPDSLVETYGQEFARLLGREKWQGYRQDGPTLEKLSLVARANHLPSA